MADRERPIAVPVPKSNEFIPAAESHANSMRVDRSSHSSLAESVISTASTRTRYSSYYGNKALETSLAIRRSKSLDMLGEMDHKVSFSSHSQNRLNYTGREYLAYMMNTWISNRRSQIILLAGTGFLFVVVIGMVWAIGFNEPSKQWSDNFFEGLWIAWIFMADPGTHAPQTGHDRRVLSAFNTVGGILFMAALLGTVVDLVAMKLRMLAEGKTFVVENKHTLILGWSEKALSIIEELCYANESAGGGCVVVLAQTPKDIITKMVDAQLSKSARRGTKVTIRNGHPMLASDLLKVSAPTARAIIVLANDGDPENSDSETLRIVISLRSMQYALEGHIVAEMRDIDNKQLVSMVGGKAAETLVSHDVLGRLILMSARQPGLAKVYESLLGFEGDEFYMKEWPQLVGLCFHELLERFPDAIPVGIKSAFGDVILNPDRSRVIESGEEIIVIAEDDDTYQPEEPVEIVAGKAPSARLEKRSSEKILFCGWRRDVRDLLNHLDNIVQAGTEIHIITSFVPLESRTQFLLDEGLDVSKLKRIRLVHHYGHSTVRRKLSALPLKEFSCCMIFTDQGFESDPMQADSHALATLLLLRDLQAELAKDVARIRESIVKSKRRPSFARGTTKSDESVHAEMAKVVECSCPVVCEILDPRTQKTIRDNGYISHLSEFCQTNKITAQMLAMVAENRTVNALFNELLGAGGTSVNVYPPTRYALADEIVSFFTLAKRASSVNEILIGVSELTEQRVILNPPNKGCDRSWQDSNMIVFGMEEPAAKDAGLADHRSSDLDSAAFAIAIRADAANMDPQARLRFAEIMDALASAALQTGHMDDIDGGAVQRRWSTGEVFREGDL